MAKQHIEARTGLGSPSGKALCGRDMPEQRVEGDACGRCAVIQEARSYRALRTDLRAEKAWLARHARSDAPTAPAQARAATEEGRQRGERLIARLRAAGFDALPLSSDVRDGGATVYVAVAESALLKLLADARAVAGAEDK